MLTGLLGAVRIKDGKTVVYLRVPNRSPDGNPSNPFGHPSSNSFPSAAIELETDMAALWMADYRSDEQIRVVVKRQSQTKTPQTQQQQHYPGNLPPMLEAHYGELRPVFIKEAHNVQLCWCFLGEGLEKPNLPETWIDPSLGRAGKLSNAGAVGRCPGVLVRDPWRYRGTSGRLTAKLSRIRKSSQGGGLDLLLTVLGTSEGAVSIVAHFGPEMQPAELLDYKTGQSVELAATVVGPEDELSRRDPSGRHPPYYDQTPPGYPRPPEFGKSLPFWRAIRVNCSQVQMQGKPSTLASTLGSRRGNVTINPNMPDVAHLDLSKVLGKEASWSGTLYRLRRRNGETHLVVSVTGLISGLRHFEAFTSDYDFYDSLADYVASSLSSRADKVSVKGTIRASDASSFRLQAGIPLLEIKELQRQGDSSSRVVVGSKRPASTMRPGTATTGLAALLRDWPPIGTEVQFSGIFCRYDTYNKEVTVVASDLSGNYNDTRVVVRFPQSNEAMFADYEDKDKVDVTATVSAHASYLTLSGKSIVQSGDPRSMVTDAGRQFAAMDFSVEENRWNNIRHKLSNNVGKKVHAWGYFSGFAKSPTSHRITVNDLFSGGSNLTLSCEGSAQAIQFLQQLKDREKVFFEFSVEVGSYNRPTGKLVWIARLSDPDRKITFTHTSSQ